MCTPERLTSYESCATSGSLCDDDVEDYYFSDEENTGPEIHPLLEKEIKMLKEYSNQTVDYRCFQQIHEVDLDVNISLSFLQSMVLDAWGLSNSKPLTIRLSLSSQHYMDMEGISKIEVFQNTDVKKTKGVLSQIKCIAEEFLRKQFRALDNETVKKAMDSTDTRRNGPACMPNKLDILRIIEMGFDQLDAFTAFQQSDGTVDGAIAWLLQQQELNETESERISSCASDVKSKSTEQESDPKAIPSLNQGFLIQFHKYICKRLMTLNDFCPVCDRMNAYDLPSMMKPVVCGEKLCIFSFQALGVMADATDTIATEPEVVSLLVHLTRAAVLSKRHGDILSPYPVVINPKDCNELAISNQNKDIQQLRELFKLLPSLKCLHEFVGSNLRTFLDGLNNMLFPLLQWIITSNRSHIILLPVEKQLTFMQTKHQYLLINSPPAEEARFRALKRKHGSVFAFHGSPIENWHSIVREGLIIGSGTKRQINGAAYGNGIYLSPHLITSAGYCGSNIVANDKNTKKVSDNCDDFITGLSSSLTCITLCEVIKRKELKKHSNYVWTLSDENLCCTRFFFVYDGNSFYKRHFENVNVSTPEIMKQIIAAIGESRKD